MSDKLPEWPGLPSTPGEYPADEWHNYWIDKAQAALARMAALVGYAEHDEGCDKGVVGENGRYLPCTCGLSELLAACERRK